MKYITNFYKLIIIILLIIILLKLINNMKEKFKVPFKNVVCDASGQHKIIDKCPDKIYNKYDIYDNFNSDDYIKLMRGHTKLIDDLNKPSEDNIKFEIILKI